MKPNQKRFLIARVTLHLTLTGFLFVEGLWLVSLGKLQYAVLAFMVSFCTAICAFLLWFLLRQNKEGQK